MKLSFASSTWIFVLSLTEWMLAYWTSEPLGGGATTFLVLVNTLAVLFITWLLKRFKKGEKT